jgi:hypothetical protein
VYKPEYVKLPNHVYNICVDVAKSYYALLQHRRETEEKILHAGKTANDGMPKGSEFSDETANKAQRIIMLQAEANRKIEAIERAWWNSTKNEEERKIIQKNLFEGVPMIYIDTTLSECTMKKIRKRFLLCLAENLYEI